LTVIYTVIITAAPSVDSRENWCVTSGEWCKQRVLESRVLRIFGPYWVEIAVAWR